MSVSNISSFLFHQRNSQKALEEDVLGYFLPEQRQKGRSQLESGLAPAAVRGAAPLLLAEPNWLLLECLNFFPLDGKLLLLKAPCVYILCLNSEL